MRKNIIRKRVPRIRRQRIKRQRPSIYFSQFPERLVNKPSEFVLQECEKVADETLGAVSKELQQSFRIGTFIKDEHPFIGSVLQVGSLCLALRQVDK